MTNPQDPLDKGAGSGTHNPCSARGSANRRPPNQRREKKFQQTPSDSFASRFTDSATFKRPFLLPTYSTSLVHPNQILHPHTYTPDTMGNGAKAAQKREKNAEKGGKEAKSQLKSVRRFLQPLLRRARPSQLT